MMLKKIAIISLALPLSSFAAQAPSHWSSGIVAMVSDYCYGDTAELDALCRQHVCSKKDWSDVAKLCSDLVVDEQWGNSSDLSTPPAPQLEVTSEVEAPPGWRPFIVEMVTDYCYGNGTEVETFCQSNFCTQKDWIDVVQYCSAVFVEENLVAEQAQKDSSLAIAWTIPTQRKDGTPMSASELGSYELYLVSEAGDTDRVFVIDDPLVTEHKIENLKPDTYHIAIAAKDVDGLSSELSQVISKEVGGS